MEEETFSAPEGIPLNVAIARRDALLPIRIQEDWSSMWQYVSARVSVREQRPILEPRVLFPLPVPRPRLTMAQIVADLPRW